MSQNMGVLKTSPNITGMSVEITRDLIAALNQMREDVKEGRPEP
jgi:hypothetical protein